MDAASALCLVVHPMNAWMPPLHLVWSFTPRTHGYRVCTLDAGGTLPCHGWWIQSFHTIGVEFLNKDMTIDDETFTMQIWDTAGQEVKRRMQTRVALTCTQCIVGRFIAPHNRR